MNLSDYVIGGGAVYVDDIYESSKAFAYDAEGNVTGETHNTPDGTYEKTYTYDADGNVTGVESELAAVTLFTETYAYDSDGNITGSTVVVGP